MVLIPPPMQKAPRHVIVGRLTDQTCSRIGSNSGLRVTDSSGTHVIDG